MRIYLGGYLDFYSPDKSRWMDVRLQEQSSLIDILMEFGIPIAEIQLVVINGESVELEQARVINNDEVKIFPPVGGG